ncbi:MAG: flagellar hook-basal body complex protein FliE [Candidatus Atribacteria bacterium]|nr:flagellar hook-basal body complex protein FliE [Candidatus Atribacteria bacterium]
MKIENGISPLSLGLEKDVSSSAGVGKFGEYLNQALQKVNNLQVEADQMVEKVARGEEDIHNALIALEKANLALGLTVQVRNKVVEAYQEIMRMQV